MKLSTFLLAFMMPTVSYAAELVDVRYKHFTITLDCATKSAVAWTYVSRKDTNNFRRHNEFYFDANVPSKCQQTSQGTYKSKGRVKYDRGHLVPANAMDFEDLAITQSNSMLNVLPQVAQMNRGAWYQTEVYVECRRDIAPVTVYGGVYRGTTPPDGNFLISHGIEAPEAFYKIALTQNKVISWWIPNSTESTAANIDKYLVTVREIEEKAGVSIPIPDFLKTEKVSSTNALTEGCNRS
ncbi:DNA/RNA non-specific endonuclease [Vibrio nigripulchritudo SOn1]|uniref:DNA/RNA non-specific endonuclease n=1 Tax=Vibrio nigripulchritudo SOn1 TaxID=1238450 RepID=A0AAV2VQT3_9VIBR|nr:DNA/RNA non-specific endonuclease [Vibrio nigripulchritudo]CCO46784.1 DNA/RNA non-specific endonuclease [Vibrio nigripulchritudo SOn1]